MNIKFADKETFDRFKRYSFETSQLNHSLDSCIISLMRWEPHDNTIVISRDFDELSFYFQEYTTDGHIGTCGGIIYHGKRDSGGDGKGPTFSVCLEPTDGYSIHT